LGIFFFPLFSILDFILLKEVFFPFLFWRITFSLFLFICLVWLRKVKSYNLAKWLCFVSYLTGGALIALMIVQMGPWGIGYYVGIILMMIGLAGILPLSLPESLIAGFSLYAVYAVILLSNNQHLENFYPVFFNNSFFFIAFIVVSSVLSFENSKGRLREFLVRQNIISLGGELSRYTDGLEQEVDSRMKKIKESELRYRELYNHIHDLLVLIDKKGTIIMANNFFCQALGLKEKGVPGSFFFNYVSRDNLEMVESQLLHRLARDKVVKGYEFCLTRSDGQCLDVECNGSLMAEGKQTGYQLVIRDITLRKKMEEALRRSQEQVGQARVATILGLAKLAEYRDEDTGDHLERMREYSRILATELASWPVYQDYITEKYIEDIYLSSILHDIGKVGIPDDVLLKPGRLTEKEYNIMKDHTTFGGDALMAVEKQTDGRSFLTLGREIAYYHHEKWDGTGYPTGLRNGRIPLSATIVALADVYDALTSKRCYKKAFSHNKAKKIIVEGRGSHFAPDIVDAFLAQEELFKRTRKEALIH
jgi:PAS domain S-box-containing protein